MKETNIFRTWAEVDLDALLDNHRLVKAHLGEDCRICAVVKADAYGHGAVRVAKLLEEETDYFAVAMAEEAYELRRAGIGTPILVLGLVPEGQMVPLIKNDVTLTIASYREGLAVRFAAMKAGKKAKVHFAIDTGMGRIGFLPCEQSVKEITLLTSAPEFIVEGCFSHFATADEEDLSFTALQKERFEQFTAELLRKGNYFPILHLSNSAGICKTDCTYKMVREGIILYGLSPSGKPDGKLMEKLRPVMTFKSRVVQIKTVPKGTPISYGATYHTGKETVVATVAMGYGDGVPRLLSNKGQMMIHGNRYPILGRVCMDQLMLDITDAEDIAVGDEAVLFGFDGKNYLDSGAQMALCESIHYELLCNINKRVPRVYIKDGEIESIANILPEE